ncbi:hydrolase [Streptomyces yokosukanensis]|uniref:Hydrolase n=1 Tax=Streptomyces yokosukanensis TaxID=67386 RepID=A0A117Q0F9_9ACTN|nr:HAD-IA family hydrolase [Streptomyces yokosukanensis]KUN02124.1 hydrolase [Streptomyces yokosukanensis]
MTIPASPTGIDALLIDYNGVIGVQPGLAQWQRLARTAAWPGDIASFQTAFWKSRDAYDVGQLSDLAFWAKVLGSHPGPRMLRQLRSTDTAMWTHTDSQVLAVLGRARRIGLTMAMLSNAPHPLSDVLDTTRWRRKLMTAALYSARLGVCKPEPAAYQQALAALGAVDPARVLFIDDRADNCHAAARLGLQTLHYTGRPAELEAVLLQHTG